MKIKISVILICIIVSSACTDLNLNPLSDGSSGNWYSTEKELEMCINDLFSIKLWDRDADGWTDDFMSRSDVNEITGATINGQFGTGATWWSNAYTSIARANTIIENLSKVADELPQSTIGIFEGNARFVRATKYALLVSHWGDVVFYKNILSIDESFTLSRTDKNTILQTIYEDYDLAAASLPVSYESSKNKWATKGAALGMKARIALYMGDYDVARDAAKACVELGEYSLYNDFGAMFLSSTKNADETIFAVPRSVELGEYFYDYGTTTARAEASGTKYYISRNAGGSTSKNPTWDLFCSFLCTDGLPIDESPLFDPHEPFKNRDPRCSETIVEFQTEHLGYMFQPHPDSTKCYSFKAGSYVKNNDTRSIAQYATYNGMVWKKGIDTDWSDDFKTAPDIIILRYADVLLMYAEAKIELGEIDNSVLNAINQVRQRAYNNTGIIYPEVTTMDQSKLRRIVRIERRMEFALEGLRYMDIIRWKLAEKVLNIPNYGMLDVADLRVKVVNPGLWFFPETPQIDEDGVADFSPMYNAGLIKRLNIKTFDSSRQYLWPIPSKEILINNNLTQNPNY